MRLAAPRFACALLAPLLCAAPSAFALIAFNDGRDTVFVSGTAGVTYDSNIFADARDAAGDTSFNASLLLEYERKAGMLGVNASVGWSVSTFSRYGEEDFADPRFSFELTKASGRTTGSVLLSAQRQHRADTAINLRTESWNYDAGLNLRYPVIERYSISANAGYSWQDYRENIVLVDIESYRAGADLLYALNSERDLLFGYRYRTTETSVDTTDVDHALYLGITGKLITKLNGNARIGWQRREIDPVLGESTTHDGLTASVATTWSVTSRFSITGNVSKDVSTVATDDSVDVTSASLDFQYGVNGRTSAFAALSHTHLRFLDGGARRDDGVGLSTGITYTFSERLRVTLSYLYFQNWSTLPTSDYDRHSISLNASTRW